MEEKNAIVVTPCRTTHKIWIFVVSRPNTSTNQEIGTKIIRAPRSLHGSPAGGSRLCGGMTHGLHISKVASGNVHLPSIRRLPLT